ncbi:MAG: alpha-glucosidase C-terminal domain-containing protein [Alteromonadaceae bacterium]|nr:alpha-glucosidase C-terminal domain-containing protein [Alteromonadaceae bacterium]
MNYAASSEQCLNRILQSLDLSFLSQRDGKVFRDRLRCHFDELFKRYIEVYGHQYDCYYHLSQLVMALAQGIKKRSGKLKQLDKARSHDKQLWFKQANQVGMACYVDLMGPTLKELKNKIPYFKTLGITYLHLMPLYDSPKGDSDGGYAVSDYRKVNPCLGNMKDLESLANTLQDAGINLVLDFVFNHTSDEHRWAQAALSGDSTYQDYYYLFEDREIPDQYEHHLREIFPQVRRGSFTWNETLKKWVWTTFNSFQWDLNYSNPAVFNAITEEMLFLANIGCAALRLDALAFIWKQMGTDCENQPKAHTLIQAFKCCLQIAAPAVVFKSEAIVHPDEVLKYIHSNECQLSYNPLLMALIWNSLATRKTRLLTTSMQKSFTIPHDCTWVNYVRCHDDIGWTFDDSVAQQLGINPYDHRHFLNQFFTGRFVGSFANGVPFAENPSNGDCRVCGSLASLCGLEGAIAENNHNEIELAINRILLVHGVIFSIGGIPLLYSGDELGLLNDYSYRDNPAQAHDDRWVNRIAVTPEHIADIDSPLHADDSLHRQVQKRVFNGLRELLRIRKSQPLLGAAHTHILTTNNQHCFVYCRTDESGQKILAICNFSEQKQSIKLSNFNVFTDTESEDLLTCTTVNNHQELVLSGYQQCWLIGN